MNQIGLFNETKEEIEEFTNFKELLEYAVKEEKLENVLFNIILIDNEEIQKLNRVYRGKDAVTDVISFALEDGMEFISMAGSPRVLGDIYISLEKAKEQAKNYGHSLKRELSFLMIHGFLHLLGYDHMKEEEEKIMFSRQELILDGFGIKR